MWAAEVSMLGVVPRVATGQLHWKSAGKVRHEMIEKANWVPHGIYEPHEDNLEPTCVSHPLQPQCLGWPSGKAMLCTCNCAPSGLGLEKAADRSSKSWRSCEPSGIKTFLLYFHLSNLAQICLLANSKWDPHREGNSGKCDSSLAKLTRDKATTSTLQMKKIMTQWN